MHENRFSYSAATPDPKGIDTACITLVSPKTSLTRTAASTVNACITLSSLAGTGHDACDACHEVNDPP